MRNYLIFENYINNFFKKLNKSLSTFPILNKLFKLYFKIIEKIKKEKDNR